jgi:hypothetical protein
MLESTLASSRTLGCEFECYMILTGSGSHLDAMRSITNVLTANGIPTACRGYSHAPIPPGIDVMIEQDASIRPESRYSGVVHVPIEMKTRIMSGMGDFDRIVPKALDILKYLGCRTNTTTGHHIHVGFPEVNEDCRNIRSLYNLIHRFEPVIFSLVSPSRRSNSYCRALPDVSKLLHRCRTLDCFRRTLADYTRYQACNMTHLFGGTGARVEFRYHQGTLDGAKARHWARLATRFVDHAVARSCQASPTQVPGTKAGLHKLLTTTGLKVNTKVYSKVAPELRETGRYLLKRWNRLNASTGTSTPRPEAEEV